MEESTASIGLAIAAATDEIRPYRIHVSSKYLELTRKKLELTRLPHEILLPPAREWEQGTPKGEVEPLIDYWLEEYSWRTREAHLNASISQYRTALSAPGLTAALRVHFIHVKSPHANAIPLLLVPAFPLTNLSLLPLIAPLTEPPRADGEADGGLGEEQQAFHVVIASLPGLGFSDAFTSTSASVLETTAHILNALMVRLSYPSYLASSTGSSAPAVDYQLPRLLASNHSENCKGIHIIDPPVGEPRIVREPWIWTKFAIARFFHAPIFGYVAEDWKALIGYGRAPGHTSSAGRSRNTEIDLEAAIPVSPEDQAVSPSQTAQTGPTTSRSTTALGLSAFGLLTTPNTLSYALCDSPVGLLSLILAGLKAVSPSHNLSPIEIIDVAQLSWLPGPEGAMRFWSAAMGEVQGEGKGVNEYRGPKSHVATAVTAFLGDESEPADYRPPMWATAYHNLVWTSRRPGRAGMIVWERPEVIFEGIRGLAAEALKTHPELRNRAEEVETVGIEMTGVVIEEGRTGVESPGAGGGGGEGMQIDVESPDTVVVGREL